MDENAVLVRAARYSGPLALLIVSIGLLIVALCSAVIPAQPLWPVALTGAVLGSSLILIGALWWLFELSRRVWVEVKLDGFVVRDRAGERTVNDRDIVSMAVRHQQNFTNGLLKSITRYFTVWIAAPENAAGPFTMTNTILPGAADPLIDLINRIGDRLLDQAHQDILNGLPILGDGWSLEGGNLIMKQKRQNPGEIRLADLTHVHVADQNVCCWTRGNDEATIKVPVKTVNAYLLLQLLAEYLQANQSENRVPEDDGSLGRIIFERRHSRGFTIIFFVLGILFGLPGLVLIAAGGAGLFGEFLVLCSAACSAMALHSYFAFFRCHERGVHKHGLFTEKRLRYDDVEVFTYHAMRILVHGAYTGTSVKLGFQPVPKQYANRIKYSANIQNADEALDTLRDHISRIIAVRMLEQLKLGQRVRWTANLVFLPEGLEYRPAGWLGPKTAEVLPYDQIYSYTVEQGTFFLWKQEHLKKPLLQEVMSAPNFFPGLMVLAMIPTSLADRSTEQQEIA